MQFFLDHSVILRTFVCVLMVKYEMLRLAVKYDVREGLSTIRDTVWSCFVQRCSGFYCVLN